MKFLVDENLSPLVVEKLNGRGHPAEKPEHVGLRGSRDDVVWAYAFEHDQAVITCNFGDFLALAHGSEVHAGLIILRRGDLLREEQWRMLEPVIARLEAEEVTGLVNVYIEVFDFGQFTWPPLPIP